MSVLAYYFGLPHGQIWPNLLASLVCVGVAWWRLHRQGAAHHAVMLTQAAAHHLEQIAQAERHHEELKAHVTATVASVPRPAPRRAKTLVTEPAKEAGT